MVPEDLPRVAELVVTCSDTVEHLGIGSEIVTALDFVPSLESDIYLNLQQQTKTCPGVKSTFRKPRDSNMSHSCLIREFTEGGYSKP